MRLRLLVPAFAVSLISFPALAADPCTAIPDTGVLPRYLREHVPFRGSVVHIIDGDGFCVATGAGPNSWVEVRLENFFAPELNAGGRRAKTVLERIALGESVTCVPMRGMNGKLTSYDRVFARCQIGRRDVGDLMRAAGVREGGRGRAARQ